MSPFYTQSISIFPEIIKKKHSNGPRCFNCNEYGHISKFCTNHKKKSNNKGFAAVFSATNGQTDTAEWYVDSGASLHMTNISDWLYDIRAAPIDHIKVANNKSVPVKQMGSVNIDLLGKDGTINHIQVKDVLYVPQLSTNLLSVSQLAKNGCEVIFKENSCEIYNKQNKLMTTAYLINNIYKLSTLQANMAFLSTAESLSIDLWHRRMGHLNYNDIKRLPLCTEGVKLLNTKDGNNNNNCISCLKGKQTRFPFHNVGTRATSPLEVIHSDLCGPMEVPSMGGARYFITFVDDYSRKVNVYFLKSKTNIREVFETYKKEMENQLDRKIKVVRTDNGLEYMNDDLTKYLTGTGIKHQTTAPYTPEQNGLAERMNRTLAERARCMLFEAGLSKCYWAEAVETAAHIINRSPTRVLNYVTPLEKLTGMKPKLSHLRVFGCKAMVHVPKEKRLKWDPKSKEMIFLGYCENSKGYRLMDPHTKKITKSRNVVFQENCYLNRDIPVNSSNIPQITLPLEDNIEKKDPVSADHQSDLDDSFDSATDDQDITYVPSTDCSFESPVNNINLRPRKRQVNYKDINENEVNFTCLFTSQDPLTLEQALLSPEASHWQQAMEDEFKLLKRNNTWTLCELPPGKKAVSCKWVFKTKRNATGDIAKYKARLVIKGCAQKKGVDYNEVFSPVIRYTSLRYLLSWAVKYNLDIDQMDAVSAFLQGDVEEEIYMHQPPNFVENDKQVCLLKKSLYGLKQASRQWNRKLDGTLKEIGLKQSLLDPCIYYKIHGEDIAFLAVYVDDLLLFTNVEETKTYIKNLLFTKFEMKDLGELKYCLGLHVFRDRNKGILGIDQRQYIQDILNRYGMQNCKGVNTPIDPKTKFNLDEKADTILEKYPYQEIIGCLLYLSQGTRPDISYAINTLSKFNKRPEMQHWVALKRILRYIKYTESYALTYRKNNKEENLLAYCDADWASNDGDRRSCTGYVFIHQGAAISWNSRRQQTVALSTTEAEYMSLSSCVQEAMWLKQMEEEFWPHLNNLPIKILCDNQSAIRLAGSENYHSRSKHIDIRHHFVRDKLRLKRITIEYIQTSEMVADALTKGTPQLKLNYCSSKMGLCLREDVGI